MVSDDSGASAYCVYYYPLVPVAKLVVPLIVLVMENIAVLLSGPLTTRRFSGRLPVLRLVGRSRFGRLVRPAAIAKMLPRHTVTGLPSPLFRLNVVEGVAGARTVLYRA